MNFRGTVVIKQEEKWFAAACIENGIASQGKTIDEAIFNLKEAISLYYEDEAETEETAQKEPFYITTLEMAHNGRKVSNPQAECRAISKIMSLRRAELCGILSVALFGSEARSIGSLLYRLV